MTQLFKPFDLNDIPLANRIVMAPMTRSRAANNIADERTALYYAQRATAGLIVTEGSPISREGQGYLFNPSIYSDEQVAGWKLTTDSVHAVGGKIFAQLWHVGRVSHTSLQPDGGAPRSATSRLAKDSIVFAYDENGKPGFVPTSTPSALSTMEVERVVEDFVSAAANAIEAGFDGVEIHAANGYLFEQFLNPLVNDRTDRYSATTRENQLRFALEVVDGIAERIGTGKIGIRISPYGQLFDMPHYPGILDTYGALAFELGMRRIAYIHVMDQSNVSVAPKDDTASDDRTIELLSRIKREAGNTPIILAGGMTINRAQELLDDGLIDLAAFGQPFIANPDLVHRLKTGLPLATADRATYYGGGLKGYVDYPPFGAQFAAEPLENVT
ncbi:UNVERIFIED_ORG: 2,4-dienoyl-CoA reductase-like NADH-dependent reductase (Old Yellow Enzyme family) [Burkholderia contaminans]|nr:2,4-dienoyl-CoA reductase-like NADH-dependent reductase (Old Yellow Enzyme family) [Burkholderia contaminans]